MRESIIEKKNADQNDAIENPGTISAATITRTAFITSEKSPKVRIFIGSVRINMSGFINIFISAKTTASTRAPISVTSTPGRRYAVIMIQSVPTSQCLKFIYYFM